MKIKKKRKKRKKNLFFPLQMKIQILTFLLLFTATCCAQFWNNQNSLLNGNQNYLATICQQNHNGQACGLGCCVNGMCVNPGYCQHQYIKAACIQVEEIVHRILEIAAAVVAGVNVVGQDVLLYDL